MDGSSDAVPVLTDSWIAEAEAFTRRRRGRCSFEGCPNMAAVGGHVWLARIGCVIAPICRPCNNPRNMARRQGGGSYLRANIEVLGAEMTEGMFNARRRYAEEPVRQCERCRVDISDRPPNHTVCLNCFRGDRGRARHDDIYDHGYCAYGFAAAQNRNARSCASCRTDISDRPPNHTVCLSCYRYR